MDKLFLLPFNIIKHNNCYICNYILTLYPFKDDVQTGIAFANVFNAYTQSFVKEQRLGDLEVVNIYCNNCRNLLGAKTVQAAYYADERLINRDLIPHYMLSHKEAALLGKRYCDEPSKSVDLFSQCMLNQKGAALFGNTYKHDFVMSSFSTESAAERVGAELYDLINGFEPSSNPLPPQPEPAFSYFSIQPSFSYFSNN